MDHRPLNNWFSYGSRNLQIAFSDYYRELKFAATVMPLIFQKSLLGIGVVDN